MFCILFSPILQSQDRYITLKYRSNIGNVRRKRDLERPKRFWENIPELSGDGVLGTVGTVEGVVVVVTDGIVDDIGVDVGANDVTEGNGVCP